MACAQRGAHGPLSGLREFPGGKVEPGGAAREALAREIEEELGCVVEVGDEVTTTSHEYDFGVVTLTTFWCRLVEGSPEPTEHAALTWLAPAKLGTLAWAPADVPAVLRVRAQCGTRDTPG